MKKHGIESQALAVALIPILILGILLESYFIYTRIGDLDRAMFDRAKLIVRQLASSSEYAVFSGNRSLLQQQVDVAFAQQDVDSVIVLDAAGNLLAGAGNSLDAEGIAQFAGGGEQTMPMREDRQKLTVYQPIVATQIELNEPDIISPMSMSKPLGAVVLVISKARLNAEKVQMLVLNLLLTLLILGFAILVAMRVSRRITLPILGMSTAVRNIGEGRLDTRIGGARVRELNELAQGINEMAVQLQRQRDTLQQRIDEATLELRAKKEEAEKANFDKTRFLAAASHDLRQPMHALGLFMGELNNRINTPEQRKIVEKVEESVEAMSGLLDSLLDISKLDAGIVVPQEQEIAIDVLLIRLAEDFSSLADKKSITLTVRATDAYVMSDPVLLERILLNLLSNAIRYGHPNGTVMLACRKRGDRMRIEVRDNGPGIPPEEQKNIFREFVQLANIARDRSKGLGLGLAIVDRLAKLMGCPLYLRSAPQRGSTFAIEVPRVPDVQELLADDNGAQATVHSAQDEFAGLQVLVVDDDALVRNGTAGLLASWGCRAELAASIADVKQLCADHRFELVICDYRLPDGNGLELADCINTHCTDKPAFILISGDTSPEVLQKVVAMGHHLLHKPVRPAKLRSMMSFVLNKQRQTV
ncbi:MAG: ATP-binding protein [Sideroxyarcus sp.]|nr:ATP-binding protein [Sideroxyarcus sp.]